MALRITDDAMTLEIDYRVVATARFSEHAAADGSRVERLHSPGPLLFSRNQAITALTSAAP